jgi:hypothetical protein
LGEVPVRPWGRERGAGSLTSFGKRPLEFLSAEFFVASDIEKLGEEPVLKTTFSRVRTAQAADLAQPLRGRYVMLRALSEVGGNPWASAAEIGVIGVR